MELIKIEWGDLFDLMKSGFGALLGLIGAIGVFRKKIKRWYLHWRAGRDTFRVGVVGAMDEMRKQLESIKSQVNPNGGTSLNDKVSQILKHQGEIDAILSDLKQEQRVQRDVLGILYWENDANGRVTYVGANLTEQLNCNPGQILGRSWIGLIDDPDKERVIRGYNLSIENASIFRAQFTFVGCDGQKMQVKAIARHNKDREQKLVNSLVIFTIIPEQ